MIVTIQEVTVGNLGGVRVPMGNMFEGDYETADGTKQRGLVCSLVLPDGQVYVGEGSVVSVNGTEWEVTATAMDPGGRGSVTLRRREGDT